MVPRPSTALAVYALQGLLLMHGKTRSHLGFSFSPARLPGRLSSGGRRGRGEGGGVGKGSRQAARRCRLPEDRRYRPCVRVPPAPLSPLSPLFPRCYLRRARAAGARWRIYRENNNERQKISLKRCT